MAKEKPRLSPEHQTILDRVKKYNLVWGFLSAVFGALFTAFVTTYSLSFKFGKFMEEYDQQKRTVAVHSIRLSEQDTAIANHRWILYNANAVTQSSTKTRSLTTVRSQR